MDLAAPSAPLTLGAIRVVRASLAKIALVTHRARALSTGRQRDVVTRAGRTLISPSRHGIRAPFQGPHMARLGTEPAVLRGDRVAVPLPFPELLEPLVTLALVVVAAAVESGVLLDVQRDPAVNTREPHASSMRTEQSREVAIGHLAKGLDGPIDLSSARAREPLGVIDHA
jgi:hypothetical protein